MYSIFGMASLVLALLSGVQASGAATGISARNGATHTLSIKVEGAAASTNKNLPSPQRIQER